MLDGSTLTAMILYGPATASGYIGAALSVGMVVPQLARTLRNPRIAGVSATMLPRNWPTGRTSCPVRPADPTGLRKAVV